MKFHFLVAYIPKRWNIKFGEEDEFQKTILTREEGKGASCTCKQARNSRRGPKLEEEKRKKYKSLPINNLIQGLTHAVNTNNL